MREGNAVFPQHSYARGKAASFGVRAWPRAGITVAPRQVVRLMLGVPKLLGALVLGVVMFALAAGAVGYAGFFFFANVWFQP